MEIISYVIVGLIGGVLGGMGMGGGTLLIPIMTLYLEVAQIEAQGINLVSFIPMSAVALYLHFKNNLIEKKDILYLIISACIFGFLGSYLVKYLESEELKKCFGYLLILFGTYQIVTQTIKFIKQSKLNKYKKI